MPDLLVLCYHTVHAAWDHEVAVHPADLRRQLTTVLQAGYEPVPLSRALEAGPPGSRRFCVTFDDGFASVRTDGLPVLASLGVTATAFVTTSFVRSGRPLCWPGYDAFATPPPDGAMTPMTWDTVRELRAAGWEVGSHSRSHPRLPQVDDERLADELVGSRRDIEEAVGGACTTLAYPYGDQDERVRAAARAAGYELAVGLGYLPATHDRYALPRVAVYRHDGPRRFALKVHPLTRSPLVSTGIALIQSSRR